VGVTNKQSKVDCSLGDVALAQGGSRHIVLRERGGEEPKRSPVSAPRIIQAGRERRKRKKKEKKKKHKQEKESKRRGLVGGEKPTILGLKLPERNELIKGGNKRE